MTFSTLYGVGVYLICVDIHIHRNVRRPTDISVDILFDVSSDMSKNRQLYRPIGISVDSRSRVDRYIDQSMVDISNDIRACTGRVSADVSTGVSTEASTVVSVTAKHLN